MLLRDLSLSIVFLLGTVRAAPCDVYKVGGTPCVAAHSTVRALLDEYDGSLYEVTRASDNQTLDISPLTAGGIADASAQDRFCEGTSCVISIIYDQSGMQNHLTSAPGGGAKHEHDHAADAGRLPIYIDGQKAYGIWVEQGIGYRNDNTNGIATGDQAQAIYMVADGTHFNDGCCFDYGNAETNNRDDGPGTMEAIYLGNSSHWTFGEGNGPWVLADLEDGLFGCAEGKFCPNIPTVNYPFVLAMLKGRSGGTFALKQGNAQSGTLQTTYDGPRPNGYTIMKKQGGIIMGIGGDNSNSAIGSFFEGAIVIGDPTDQIDDSVQMEIVRSRYGFETANP